MTNVPSLGNETRQTDSIMKRFLELRAKTPRNEFLESLTPDQLKKELGKRE